MKHLLVLVAVVLSSSAQAARIKDLASLRGARANQLLGYGVVVGLSGTGDRSSELTENSMNFALKGMGIDLKTQKMDTKNVAAVIVSAVLPAFAKNGSLLDVTVSSIGSATSLNGGNLMATSLRGPDGVVYAMAQGKIITVKRADQNKVTGQTMVTASVPGGAILEKEVTFDFASLKELRYHLANPDFTTAARIAHRVNEELGGKYASAADAGTVDVILPYSFDGTTVELVAQIESIDVEADRRAKVVINQRTGTVVLGEHVQIAPVAIAHNNLKIEIRDVPREGPGVGDAVGTTVRTKNIVALKSGPSIADVAASLNEMGATADDLVALIQSLKASGALMAEVEMQ